MEEFWEVTLVKEQRLSELASEFKLQQENKKLKL